MKIERRKSSFRELGALVRYCFLHKIISFSKQQVRPRECDSNFLFAEIPFWTSLTDTRRDGTWVWEGTMTILDTGDYTHWFPGRPSSATDNEEDCMLYGGNTFLAYWGDVNCTTTLANAICEAHP